MITFQGFGDDTFGWMREDGLEADHDDCARGTVRTFSVTHDTGRLAVTGVFGAGCMWAIGIGVVEDYDPLPDWELTWTFEGYSPILTIGAPEDAEVRLVYPAGADARGTGA